MANFFIEGGFGMYPVLVLGLILLFSSLRYAWDSEPVRLRLIAVLALALLANTCGAMLTDLAQVMWYLGDPARAPQSEFLRILVTGLKESSRPGILGFALLSLASFAVAVGVYRGVRKELRAARG